MFQIYVKDLKKNQTYDLFAILFHLLARFLYYKNIV